MTNASSISIQNGRLVDPANGIDEPRDLHIAAGKVLATGSPPEGFQPDLRIDASGQVVCPGLVDLCARLREPGEEHKATIASESAAAAGAGITTLCCPPDTDPIVDTPAVAELIRRKALQAGLARVLPMGALTRGLKGEQLSEMAALKQAGCHVMSNGARPLHSTLVERRALEYATTFGLTCFLNPEDLSLRDQGCAHEGAVGCRLGLPGIPVAAETVAVARDLALLEQTRAIIHFRGLSTAAAVRMLRRAHKEQLRVTADVSAHQLHLTEMDLDGFNSNCHVEPPLRSLTDRDALRQALADGVISAVCSDHQPHEPDAKQAPFPATAPGISALETLLPLTLKLVSEGVMPLADALARLTIGPARILGLEVGRLNVGNTADVCVFDPNRTWRLDPEKMLSQGHNTPFAGWEFSARVTCTLLAGRVVYRQPDR
jgi:dihydroorotase